MITMQREWFSSSVEETYQIAQEVGSFLEEGKISPWIFLKGDIGSGKTTFVRGLLSYWGITEGVCSPTFSLIHHYPHPERTIYHVDLYRLRSSEEGETIGLYELFQPGYIVLVEWPEIVEKDFSFPHTTIAFSYGEEENTRYIFLTSEGSL
ncbi:MAG: tRNA (adenosine(37)-N6)-threonylcarbamoyltransferase complex ATPase subunit type 1 TsaE [Brevinematales bacterium]